MPLNKKTHTKNALELYYTHSLSENYFLSLSLSLSLSTHTHTHTHTYIYIQISLNIVDIFCLHISFWIRLYSRITFIVFGGN